MTKRPCCPRAAKYVRTSGGAAGRPFSFFLSCNRPGGWTGGVRGVYEYAGGRTCTGRATCGWKILPYNTIKCYSGVTLRTTTLRFARLMATTGSDWTGLASDAASWERRLRSSLHTEDTEVVDRSEQQVDTAAVRFEQQLRGYEREKIACRLKVCCCIQLVRAQRLVVLLD